ncbi:hypothetical protein QQ045_008136 [Rhodiola kirilowii]
MSSRVVKPIFCGNLDYDSRQSDIEKLFGKYGNVERVDLKFDNPLEVERGGLDGESMKLCQMMEVEESGKLATTDQLREDGTVPVQKLCEKVVDAEELERRVNQRKEAEKMFHFNWRVGIRGSLSEEGMIHLFDNMLEDKYVERMNGK